MPITKDKITMEVEGMCLPHPMRLWKVQRRTNLTTNRDSEKATRKQHETHEDSEIGNSGTRGRMQHED